MALSLAAREATAAWPARRSILLGGVVAVVAWLLVALGPGARPAYALERRTGDSLVIPASEVIDDDVFLSGRQIRIEGTVHGDVYAMGQHIDVPGTVQGDLIALGQLVNVDGNVNGSVRAAGSNLQLNGAIGRNVTGAAQLLLLGSGGRVGGSLIGAGETLSVFGDVGGSLAGAGDSVDVSGRVGRGAELALNALTIGPTARIGGDLTYYADHQLNVPAAAVAGTVHFTQTERHDRQVRRTQASRFAGAVGNFFSLAWLVGSAVAGLVILRAFPRFVARFLDALERRPVPSFLVGLVALVATLPLALFFAVTVIGLPIAALLTGGYFAGLFGGWLLLAAALGSILVGLVRRGAGVQHLSWAFLLGLLVLHIGSRLPFAGPLVTFVALSLGLGALLTAIYGAWQRAEMGAAPPVSTARGGVAAAAGSGTLDVPLD